MVQDYNLPKPTQYFIDWITHFDFNHLPSKEIFFPVYIALDIENGKDRVISDPVVGRLKDHGSRIVFTFTSYTFTIFSGFEDYVTGATIEDSFGNELLEIQLGAVPVRGTMIFEMIDDIEFP